MFERTVRPTVAVVEDDPSSRNAVGRLLQAAGFEAALFESAEAFLAAPPRTPLCLILDVHLDGMSGTDLQEHLRSTGSTMPIIITTAHREACIRNRAEKNGCAAFLWKPFTGAALLSVVSAVTEHPTT